MISIREEQLAALKRAAQQATRRAAAAHLRSHHLEAVATLGDDELAARVAAILDEAAQHELSEGPDVLRFASFCAMHGWDVLGRPENAWMHGVLDDRDISVPGKRLDALLDAVRYRQEVEAHNRHILAEFMSGDRSRAGS